MLRIAFPTANSTVLLPPRQDRFRSGSTRAIAACRCSGRTVTLRKAMRRDTKETYQGFLTRFANASEIETPMSAGR